MQEWNDREELRLQAQSKKAKRTFFITLIAFSIVIIVGLLVGLYFSGIAAKGLCGITNC
jgi:flagellar basal body-associated protein FliL